MSGPLPHLGLLRFAGADAHSFLQGQLTHDTRRLTEGSPLLAAYCTAQGRVVAVLHLLPHTSGVIALLPRELVAPVLERLRRFVLRARVTLEDLSQQFGVIGEHGSPALQAARLRLPDAAGYVEHAGIGVARIGADPGRYWVIGPAASLAAHGLADERGAGGSVEQVERHWRLADIRAGLAQVYAATSELFVPQMLNLDLIDGISFTKGCFTGQEIVARTQHLGRIKRRMFRLRLPQGSWTVGQALKLTDGRAGRLTELARDREDFEALAVLSLEADAAQPEAAPGDAVAAVELPLPYPVRADSAER